jgi:hypothetical protein
MHDADRTVEPSPPALHRRSPEKLYWVSTPLETKEHMQSTWYNRRRKHGHLRLLPNGCHPHMHWLQSFSHHHAPKVPDSATCSQHLRHSLRHRFYMSAPLTYSNYAVSILVLDTAHRTEGPGADMR